MNRLHWISVAAVVVAVAFALKALVLIDATALWGDELYSVGKSFQSSPQAMVEMLREDTHPPLYYALLWCWGQVVGQTPISLRLLSWLAYLAGGAVMVAQALALANGPQRQQVLALSMVLAFCSPYPVRFAIEGKAMPCWCCWWPWPGGGGGRNGLLPRGGRCPRRPHPFLWVVSDAGGGGLGWQSAALTLAKAALLGSLPAIAWIGYAAEYLFSSRSGSWIGSRISLCSKTPWREVWGCGFAQAGPGAGAGLGIAPLGRDGPAALGEPPLLDGVRLARLR